MHKAARLAQSVEHQTFNLRVKGSSPLSGLAIFFSSSPLMSRSAVGMCPKHEQSVQEVLWCNG